MADTRVQLEVEDWVRRQWLPGKFGGPFYRDRVKLSSGGVFDFDAVSVDKKVVASISTSGGMTSGGKRGAGKLQKIRADMLFLLLAEAERRVVVLTSEDMFSLCEKEKTAGRVPQKIEFALAEIPPDLSGRLKVAQQAASKEVSPSFGDDAIEALRRLRDKDDPVISGKELRDRLQID